MSTGSALSPLRKVAKGNQYNVYTNGSHVVKAQRPIKPRITPFPFPLDRPTASYLASERISKMVLPFVIYPELECRITYARIYTIKRRFKNAVIQELMPEETLLDRLMTKHIINGRVSRLGSTLSQIAGFAEETIRQGLFLPDPVPSNFCHIDGEIKLLDCGMLQQDRENVLRVLRGSDKYQKYLTNIPLILGIYCYSVAQNHHLPEYKLQQSLVALKAYTDALAELSQPEKVADLWGTA